MTPAPAALAADPPDLAALDLADPRLHAEQDLTGLWRHLRDTDPVHRHRPVGAAPPFWVVTRHADVLEVYRDAARFTSTGGNVLETALAGGDPAAGRMLAVSDGHRHRRLRGSLLAAFTPAALEPVVAGIHATVDRLLDEVVAAGGQGRPCEFAADVAARIPLGAVCDLLAVPEADRAEVLRLTSSALGSEHADGTALDAWEAKSEILLYFAGLVAGRAGTGHHDVITRLTATEIDGERLTADEVMLNCYSLVLGGDETTRLTIVGAVAALAAQPDEWARLRDGEVGVDRAVEEVLRRTSPALHGARTATRDTELGGRRIATGDLLTGWNVSANHDERVFDEPDRLRLDRHPNRHVSFAHGPHFCLGAQLARTEIAAVLAGLRDRVARIELAGPSRPVYSNFLHGHAALPVLLTPRRR